MPGSTATADAVLAQPGLQLTSLLTTNEVGVLSGHAKLTYLAILGLVFGLLAGTVTQTRGAVYLHTTAPIRNEYSVLQPELLRLSRLDQLDVHLRAVFGNGAKSS